MSRPATILGNGRFWTNGRFESGSLRITSGVITEISPNLAGNPRDRMIDLEGASVLPGLINSHDHLEFNLYERIGSPPYANYIQWGEDIHRTHKDYIRQVQRVPLRYRLLWGAYKNIFSGVTTVVHHNPYYFRFRMGYPVEVYKDYTWIHSLALDSQLHKKLAALNGKPCIIHLAEGTDNIARSELSRLHELGGLRRNTVLVHGVGLSAGDLELIARTGASLVWCPGSNDFMFSRTAPIQHLPAGIRVALGTDSTLTGSPSLFEEIHIASTTTSFTARSLLEMVTETPARIFGMKKGAILPGFPADLLVLDAGEPGSLNGFVNLDAGKVRCLIRNGVAIYGDEEAVASGGTQRGAFTRLRVGGKRKCVRGNLGRLLRRIRRDLPGFIFNALPIELEPAG